MTVARQCDICGGFYPHKFHEINGIAYLYDILGENRNKRNAMDCCPECMIRINELIDQIREENKNESADN